MRVVASPVLYSDFGTASLLPVMLVGSFFNPIIQIYEVHNNGTEYNLGYLIGVALVFLILGVFGRQAALNQSLDPEINR
jgi:hypothetical protein